MLPEEMISQTEWTANTKMPASKWAKNCGQFIKEKEQELIHIFKNFNFMDIYNF